MPTPLPCFFRVLIGALLGWAALPASAQQLPEGRSADFNRHLWLTYQGSFRLSERWGAYTEAQLRRADSGDKAQQSLFRLAADFQPCKNLQLSGGYAYHLSSPYGDFPAADRAPEHRLYQQVLLRDETGRVHTQHRYRLEQRWIRWPEESAYTYQNRIRYQLRLAVPLLGKTMVKGMPYLAASNELMLNFGRHVERNVFDQNRLYAGLGYVVSKNTRIEGGYLHQLLQQRNGRVLEHNHTLQLGMVLDLDLRPTASL